MAEKNQLNQINLTVVALVALVAIVGLVALVMNAANFNTVQLSTGNQLASAENAAGDAKAIVGPPIKQATVYTGNLVMKGVSYPLTFDSVQQTLLIVVDGSKQVVVMQKSGSSYYGNWIYQGQVVDVSIDTVQSVAVFSFKDGAKIVAVLKPRTGMIVKY